MISDIQSARLLGFVSLGLGATALFSGSRAGDTLGLEKPGLMETVGGREIATGLIAMGYPDRAWPIWVRVAGDVMDLSILAVALGSGNRRRHNAAWAAIGVLGLTLVDVAVAAALTRREQKALTTARRTRVQRSLGQPMPKAA